MLRFVEAFVFAAIALVVHVAIWQIPTGPAEGAGEHGADTVSLMAADGDIQDLVAQWDQSPAVTDVLQRDQTPPPEDQPLSPPDVPTPAFDAPVHGAAPSLDVPRRAELDPTQAQMAAPSVDAPVLAQINTPRFAAAVALPVTRPGTPLAAPPPPSVTTLPNVDMRPILPAKVITRHDTTLTQSLRPKVPRRPRPVRVKPAKPNKRAEPKAKVAPAKAPKTTQSRNASTRKAGGGSRALRAKGTGKRGVAGRNGTSKTSGDSQGKTASLVVAWGRRVQYTLARHSLTGAGRGVAKVQLTVARSGKLLSVRVLRSSGIAAIDRRAVNSIRRIGRFPAAPKGLRLRQHSFNIEIEGR